MNKTIKIKIPVMDEDFVEVNKDLLLFAGHNDHGFYFSALVNCKFIEDEAEGFKTKKELNVRIAEIMKKIAPGITAKVF